jgi:hypothetical protein
LPYSARCESGDPGTVEGVCVAVRCPQCGKATWAGCGDHVEEALAPFPAEQRCTCETRVTQAR